MCHKIFMRWIGNIFLGLLSFGFVATIVAIIVLAMIFAHYSANLPDHAQLENYEPPVITRMYAGNGELLAEYAQEKRIFIPVQKMPDTVKQAFISAEDKSFYDHSGVDIYAIARAMLTNVKNAGSGRRLIGASTITQQVAKNFFFTNEVSFERKIKEAILALRIEKVLTKDQILELYLNDIFLGRRAYGVGAASLRYFNKPINELEIQEAAFLAALPKAPNNYSPDRYYDRAIDRRNWVLGRMQEDGRINEGQMELAQTKPLQTDTQTQANTIEADFFAEEVRRVVKEKYGQESLYRGGLTVRTSLDPVMQDAAMTALRTGLMAYDKRHGWRGPVAQLDNITDWKEKLSNIQRQAGMLDNWQLGVVLSISNTESKIGLENDQTISLTLEGVRWARKCLNDCYALGPEIIKMDQVLNKGDVIILEQNDDQQWELRQIPRVQGAIIALDPHTGRVLAMQGGWQHNASSFDRATQAKRQPGSAFKPFVYLAALDKGYTPSTLVLDAPFVIEQAPGDFWRPTNYSNKYYGPSTLRLGIEKSRNLMTVRLANDIGMDTIVDYAQSFGIADNMKDYLSYSLGAGETTLLKLTTAYGILANGGKKIVPTFIDRIQNRYGETVFSFDQRPCINCGDMIRWDGQETPLIPDSREQAADNKTVYQIVSMLEGVVQRGTARSLKSLNRPIAGKTGTTNQSKDVWFIGFSPNLVAGVFIGFDDPKSLGKRETGSSLAAPIWGDFMEQALKDQLPMPFRVPAGIKNIRVNAKTGRLANATDENVIWEAFITGTEPDENEYFTPQIIGGADIIDPFGQDPYGYEQFGYGDYEDNSLESENLNTPPPVEIYDLDDPDHSMSYFSKQQQLRQQRQNPALNNQAAPQNQLQAPPQNNNSMSGTGGLY